VVELKVLHKSLEQTIAKGLDQTRTYMDTCGTRNGHLVTFNRDPDVPWEDKIFHRTEICRGIPVQIWGMWPAGSGCRVSWMCGSTTGCLTSGMIPGPMSCF
jgi:hypothetical protein